MPSTITSCYRSFSANSIWSMHIRLWMSGRLPIFIQHISWLSFSVPLFPVMWFVKLPRSERDTFTWTMVVSSARLRSSQIKQHLLEVCEPSYTKMTYDVCTLHILATRCRSILGKTTYKGRRGERLASSHYRGLYSHVFSFFNIHRLQWSLWKSRIPSNEGSSHQFHDSWR